MSAPALIIYPDPRLSEIARPVARFDDTLHRHALALVEVLRREAAIGLAGPHIGLHERIVVLRMEPGTEPLTYVNPSVTWSSPERSTHEEGSVSMPGIRDTVERPARIGLRYQDLDGAEHEAVAAGFEAACLQHEIDQLDGIFWIDRLTRLRRERARKRFAKLQRLET